MPINASAGPTVVVKRKKTLDHVTHSTPAPRVPGDAQRHSRVFRVAPAAQEARANGADAPGTRQCGVADSQPALTDAVRAVAARRRRRIPRAPVTIIRPGQDVNAQIDGPSEFRNPVLSSSSVEPDLRFGQDPDDHRRYVELQLEIEGLQREAQVLKKAEAAVAARWIRKAIAKYALGASELGL